LPMGKRRRSMSRVARITYRYPFPLSSDVAFGSAAPVGDLEELPPDLHRDG